MDDEQQKQSTPEPKEEPKSVDSQDSQQSTQQPEPAMESSNQAVVGKKNKNVGLIIAIIVLILLIAGGAVYAINYFASSSPDDMVKSAVDNLAKESQIETQYTADVNGTTASGTLAYAVDPGNSSNSELVFTTSFAAYDLGLRVLTVDGTSYVNATGIDDYYQTLLDQYNQMLGEELVINYESLGGQWISVSEAELQSLVGAAGEEYSDASALATAGAISLSDLAGAYDNYQFITAKNVYADEVIGSTSCVHYGLGMNGATFAAFLQDLQNTNAGDYLSDEQIAEIENNDAYDNFTVETWIAKDSKTFKEIKVTYADESNAMEVDFMFSPGAVEFDSFEVPANAITMTEYFQELTGSTYVY